MSDPVTTRRAVRTVPLDEFTPHPENPKAHDLDAIITSIRRFGFADPVVVDQRTGLTVSGHGRIEALQVMRDRGDPAPDGVEGWKVPTYTGWASADDDDARGMIVALNRLTETGGWDDQALAGLLDQLATVDNGLDGIGYVGDDLGELRDRLDALMPPDPTDDPDDVDPTPVPDPTAAPGDLWAVGPHRIVCGDATDPDVYDRLLDGIVAEMVWTDPPYGINYSTKNDGHPTWKTRDYDGIANDDLEGEDLYNLISGALGTAIGTINPGGAVWVTASPGRPFLEVGRALADLDVWRTTIAWVKDRFVLSAADFHPRWEAILYGWEPSESHRFYGDRTNDTAWEIPRPARSDDHPTMKPVELVERALLLSSRRGEGVLDPFAGSGTTLVAAARTGRVGYGIELDPRYVDVIVARLERETGETAVRLEPDEDG